MAIYFIDYENVHVDGLKDGTFDYDLSTDIAWLYKENTGMLPKEEYDTFIDTLKSAQENGQYILSKPYYIYSGIKL